MPSDALISAVYRPPFCKVDKSKVTSPSPSIVVESSKTKVPGIDYDPITISKVNSSNWLSSSETLILKVWVGSCTKVSLE